MNIIDLIDKNHLVHAHCERTNGESGLLYPSYRKKRNSAVRSFDVALSGRSTDYVGFSPNEFLSLLVNKEKNPSATVRMSQLHESRFGEGNKISRLSYSDELKLIVQREIDRTRSSDFSAINLEFQERVSSLNNLSLDELSDAARRDQSTPKKRSVTTIVYDRSPAVVAATLKIADGICMLCNHSAPFLRRSDDTPYLEVHHIVPLSEDGEDSLENVLAICPNCHRKAHYG